MAQRPQPPPPPPPPPPANVPLPLTPKQQPLITRGGWPRRLLHVERMTSYLREGENTYDGVEAPRYNALSYTWGRYTAQEPSLVIHGIDWPIPGVARSHFTVAAFEQAILRAAKGRKSPECEWLWLDVACIPQRHEAESDDSKKLRNEEIGRQVEIFHGACEVFAWLSSLHTGSFLRHDSDHGPESMEELIDQFHIATRKMRNQDPSPWPSFYASELITRLERNSEHLLHWKKMVLAHPWFTSLWTLQEMVLRRHAWILLDDGLLYVGGVAYDLNHFQQEIYLFRAVIEEPRYQAVIVEAMRKVSPSTQDARTNMSNDFFLDRMKTLVQLYENRGLGLFAMYADYPHATYSAAKQRDATRLVDRILGIMQIYAIKCNPDPPGVDQETQLHHLEDEFGEHLVAKYPLLSQLFIHTCVEEPPRRSWLITKGCSADDQYWVQFTYPDWEVGNHFETLTTVRSADKLNVDLYFKGMAWDLDSFVHASSPNSERPDADKKLLFSPLSFPSHPMSYRGLILDHHVSATALRRPVHFFSTHEAMEVATQKLYDRYDLKVHHPKGSRMVRPSTSIKVAPLGWSCQSRIVPNVAYVGLVLARSPKQSPPVTRPTTRESQPLSKSAFTWERLGLMRWVEHYTHKTTRRHYHLPEPHEFEAVVV